MKKGITLAQVKAFHQGYKNSGVGIVFNRNNKVKPITFLITYLIGAITISVTVYYMVLSACNKISDFVGHMSDKTSAKDEDDTTLNYNV